jgi:hypothetical protein
MTGARIHQALETVNHLAAFEQHNGDLGGAVPQPGEMPVVSKSMTAKGHGKQIIKRVTSGLIRLALVAC